MTPHRAAASEAAAAGDVSSDVMMSDDVSLVMFSRLVALRLVM